jgi:hypothetical protein
MLAVAAVDLHIQPVQGVPEAPAEQEEQGGVQTFQVHLE